MCNAIRIDFFFQLFLIEKGFFPDADLLLLVDVCACFYMCGINKYFFRINEMMLETLFKDSLKNLFKQVGPLRRLL